MHAAVVRIKDLGQKIVGEKDMERKKKWLPIFILC